MPQRNGEHILLKTRLRLETRFSEDTFYCRHASLETERNGEEELDNVISFLNAPNVLNDTVI